jgi:hypothetical protein
MLRFAFLRFAGVAIVVTWASVASAQLQSDRVPMMRTVPTNEALRQELEASRYHFGTLRVRPLFSIRDFGYDTNVLGTAGEDKTGDWRATIGVGAKALQPIGSKVYLHLEALPQYTWYRKLTERRTLGGTYAGSMLFTFNRMPMEFGVRQTESEERLSSENEQLQLTTRTNAYARAEIQILKRLALFGGIEGDRPRYNVSNVEPSAPVPVEQLERNDSAVRGGVRYSFRPHFAVGVGVEETQSDFIHSNDGDNRTHAAFLQLNYDLPRTFLNAVLSSRRGEAMNGSSFIPFSTPTGSYFVTHQLGTGTNADVHGWRSIVYSLYGTNPYYFETRNGVGYTAALGRRAGLRFFGDFGTNDYPTPTLSGGQMVKRSDRATTLGGGILFHLYRNLLWSTVATSTRYDSNLKEFNRSLLTVTTSVTVSGDFLQ